MSVIPQAPRTPPPEPVSILQKPEPQDVLDPPTGRDSLLVWLNAEIKKREISPAPSRPGSPTPEAMSSQPLGDLGPFVPATPSPEGSIAHCGSDAAAGGSDKSSDSSHYSTLYG